MLSCVYHFANGLWTQGITWGLCTSAAAQRRASYISVVVGIGLAAAGLSSLAGMRGLDIKDAEKIETKMEAQRKAVLELDESAVTPNAAPTIQDK